MLESPKTSGKPPQGAREANKARRREMIVETARSMIRDSGHAGFSLVELAKRAGVSPATPYNLIGPRTKILEEIIREEFSSFRIRLAAIEGTSGIDRILAATKLITEHYGAEPAFYRGLYGAMNTAGGEELRYLMLSMGRDLWARFIEQAVELDEIDRSIDADLFTDHLLLVVSATTLAWIMERAPSARASSPPRPRLHGGESEIRRLHFASVM